MHEGLNSCKTMFSIELMNTQDPLMKHDFHVCPSKAHVLTHIQSYSHWYETRRMMNE